MKENLSVRYDDQPSTVENVGEIVSSNQEMRFLVTQSCNYRCKFCHGEGLQSKKHNELVPDDFGFLFAVGKKYFHMSTVTLTGGEPLFRKDIVEISRVIFEQGGLITLTTNGSLLSHRMDIGKYLNKINLSLHSLDAKSYEGIVRQKKGTLQKVTDNIILFRSIYPNITIVFNTTIVDGDNSEQKDYEALLEFAEQVRASVKFIELFPVEAESFVPLSKISAQIRQLGFTEENNSARKTNFSRGAVVASITRILCSQAELMDNPGLYCTDNNDLFVSPDGKIKPCREINSEIDMLAAIKDRDEVNLATMIQQSFDSLGANCRYNRLKGI